MLAITSFVDRMLFMTKKMRFGLERTATSERLAIDVPESVLEKAKSKDPLLETRLGVLARQRLVAVDTGMDGSWRVAINAKAIGRKGLESKINSLERINTSLSALITDVDAEEADPTMSVISYGSLFSGDFGLAVEVVLPQVDRTAMNRLVEGHMSKTAQDLQMLPKPTSQGDYERLVAVSISDEDGISLSLSTHSSIHTMGEDYRPGSDTVELWDNNVIPGFEPIVYLVGVTALAHADELA